MDWRGMIASAAVTAKPRRGIDHPRSVDGARSEVPPGPRLTLRKMVLQPYARAFTRTVGCACLSEVRDERFAASFWFAAARQIRERPARCGMFKRRGERRMSNDIWSHDRGWSAVQCGEARIDPSLRLRRTSHEPREQWPFTRVAWGVTCARCEVLDKKETDCVRRLEAAQTRLHSFCPEPPYDDATVDQLQSHQRAVEYWRDALDKAKRERNAHFGTHSLTLTR